MLDRSTRDVIMGRVSRFHKALNGPLIACTSAALVGCGLVTSPADTSNTPAFHNAADWPPRIGPTGADRRDLAPDEAVTVSLRDRDAGGRLTDVTLTDAAGRRVAGDLSPDGSRWRSTGSLTASSRHTVRVDAEDGDSSPLRWTTKFATASARRTVDVTFGPAAGTYGVGQPITAELGVPLSRKKTQARALVERALKVTSRPRVDGSWHWINDRELHYRPRSYWPAHARVDVRAELRGVKVNDGLHMGRAKPVSVVFGSRFEAVTDAGAHSMTVKRDGKVVRVIPITTGKPGYATRNGVKVVLDKRRSVRMHGTSIGIPSNSPDAFDLVVHNAVRVTQSGEYLHAAPWSTGAQGRANVSHGCTGMSERDAAWFFASVREGDIVEVVNSGGARMAAFGNGYGDWNLPWAEWRAGSALPEGSDSSPAPPGSARLHPQER
ncbi:hypothetical protein GCM10012286_06260 [Streptomyces lasiicapitis]|uniref:L,D-TPase catalytic domain-containing protein n=2 Tax=Streptomyces lasiicapitis TaxID=1923961 RepID=A0ABQ2LIE4_9ACTN|nr:hypothetical protein GCM10012286_06260 [Streptomyces lasiicapitis]